MWLVRRGSPEKVGVYGPSRRRASPHTIYFSAENLNWKVTLRLGSAKSIFFMGTAIGFRLIHFYRVFSLEITLMYVLERCQKNFSHMQKTYFDEFFPLNWLVHLVLPCSKKVGFACVLIILKIDIFEFHIWLYQYLLYFFALTLSDV